MDEPKTTQHNYLTEEQIASLKSLPLTGEASSSRDIFLKKALAFVEENGTRDESFDVVYDCLVAQSKLIENSVSEENLGIAFTTVGNSFLMAGFMMMLGIFTEEEIQSFISASHPFVYRKKTSNEA